MRTELGLARTASRFPRKGTCLAVYSYTVNAKCPLEETLAQGFPWCADWAGELRRLFEAYVVAKQCDNVLDYDDLLLYWRHAMAEPRRCNGDPWLFRPCPVDETEIELRE